MKKILPLLVAIMCAISLLSCDNNAGDITDTPSSSESDTDVTELAESPATDFVYQLSPEGNAVYINKYIGTDEIVAISAEIEGLPVTVLYGVTRDDGFINGAFEGG